MSWFLVGYLLFTVSGLRLTVVDRKVLPFAVR